MKAIKMKNGSEVRQRIEGHSHILNQQIQEAYCMYYPGWMDEYRHSIYNQNISKAADVLNVINDYVQVIGEPELKKDLARLLVSEDAFNQKKLQLNFHVFVGLESLYSSLTPVNAA